MSSYSANAYACRRHTIFDPLRLSTLKRKKRQTQDMSLSIQHFAWVVILVRQLILREGQMLFVSLFFQVKIYYSEKNKQIYNIVVVPI